MNLALLDRPEVEALDQAVVSTPSVGAPQSAEVCSRPRRSAAGPRHVLAALAAAQELFARMPATMKTLVESFVAGADRETLAVTFLDADMRVIATEQLASEAVARRAVRHNAAAVVCAQRPGA